MHVTFEDWTSGREVTSFGTNAGSEVLPFQKWRHFKEAYTPELVHRAIASCGREVRSCLDPFGGSGTTALACQFLGVSPSTIEVSPYLADLIEAKLTTYDADRLAKDFGNIVNEVRKKKHCCEDLFGKLPPSFVEPGVKDRWIFNKDVAEQIASYLKVISELESQSHIRFFKILLGGILIQVSNVVVHGKGRRYRKAWKERTISVRDVDSLFSASVQIAIGDIHKYQNRSCLEYQLVRGDCRSSFDYIDEFDLSVFSPPYPNSFDYTDVYNVELWMLGYIDDSMSNRSLRVSTLCSHVQVAREYKTPPNSSKELLAVFSELSELRDKLWDKRIPDMVGGYFADMELVLDKIIEKIAMDGEIWMVVGDSKYAGIHIKTADILRDIAENKGLKVKTQEPFRSMRMSPQQGGSPELAESLLVLQK